MRRVGLEPEGRKFTPHVTLARLRDTSSQAVADYLSVRGYFPSRAFMASRFVLYSSRASVGGGPYIVEDAYALEGDMSVRGARSPFCCHCRAIGSVSAVIAGIDPAIHLSSQGKMDHPVKPGDDDRDC